MTPVQLATECVMSMTRPAHCGVMLTIKKGKMPKGFPRGELFNEMRRDGVIERVYSFDPQKVLAWLVKNGLVVVRKTGDKTMAIEEPNK